MSAFRFSGGLFHGGEAARRLSTAARHADGCFLCFFLGSYLAACTSTLALFHMKHVLKRKRDAKQCAVGLEM